MTEKDTLESTKLSLQNTDTMSDVKHNPVVSPLLSLLKGIPLCGDLIDNSIESLLKHFQTQKQKELLNIIESSAGTITSDMVNDVEFIMSYLKTGNAIAKLLNADKVKFYGNLLVNGYLSEQEKISADEFEEYLELLNSLSYRELEYLVLFKEFSSKHNGRLVYQNWTAFRMEFQNKFPNRNINSAFKRLQRTGFINEVIETGTVDEGTLSLDINSIGFEAEPEFFRFNEMVLKTFSENQANS